MSMKFTFLSNPRLTAMFLFIATTASAFADDSSTTIFYEDFGTASSEKDELIEDHVWDTNSADMFSWSVSSSDDNINVRTNNASDYDGASGDGNLYFKGSATFTISGIDTQNYSEIVLTFGAFGKNKGDVECMILTITDADGSTTSVDFADLGLDTTKKTWSVASISDIPSTSSLTLSYESDLEIDDDGGIRLDDILLSGTAISTGISSVSQGVSAFSVSGKTITCESNAEIFSLSGNKVASVKAGSSASLTSSGAYIIRCGEKVSKIIIR